MLGETLNKAAAKGRAPFLFLDEVQNLSEWAPQLKHLVDLGKVRAMVTGSSALRIEAGHDSLAGRVQTIEMGPLLLREIAELRGLARPPVLSPNGLAPLKEKAFWQGLRLRAKRIAPFATARSQRSPSAVPIPWRRSGQILPGKSSLISSTRPSFAGRSLTTCESGSAGRSVTPSFWKRFFGSPAGTLGNRRLKRPHRGNQASHAREGRMATDPGLSQIPRRRLLIRLIEPLELRLKRRVGPRSSACAIPCSARPGFKR